MPKRFRAELELRRRIAALGAKRARKRKIPRGTPTRSVQLEYQKGLHELLASLYEIVRTELDPVLESILAQSNREHARLDSSSDEITRVFERIRLIFGRSQKQETIVELPKKIGKKGVAEGQKIFQRQISAGIRLQIVPPTAIAAPILDGFVASNADLVKSLTGTALDRMKTIVSEGVRRGTRVGEISQALQEELGVSTRRASLIARDQTLKLFGEIAETQQRAAGIDEYTWSTSDDERVRDAHEELDGTLQKWSDPPVVDPRTGRRGHPGSDYQCRCVAIPVMPD